MARMTKYGEYGTYVRIPVAKPCDIDNCKCNAAYDTVTKSGSWANLCEEHYKIFGIGTLGIGRGQRYIISSNDK